MIVVASADVDGLNSVIEATAAELNSEYKVTDPELTVNVNPAEMPATALPEDVQNALLLAIQACPVGIHRMSPDIEGLVQTQITSHASM